MLKKLSTAMLALLAAAAFAATDINKADQAELESIKGIGPALSQRILDERKNGAFKDWSDLIGRIGGVGAGNAARLSSAGLTVNGSSYAKPPANAQGKAKAAAAAAAPSSAPPALSMARSASAASDAKGGARVKAP